MRDVAIVGAGLAGLSCALRLREIGLSYTVLEESDAAGGRMRTDVRAGFRLDRGFQTLLTADPESERMLDFAPLDLRKFDPGVSIRCDGQFRHYALRSGMRSFANPIGSVGDTFRLLSLIYKTTA